MKPFRVRGRFDILVPFEDGAYVRFTSDKRRSLSAAEIVASLRKYLTAIEDGIEAEKEKHVPPISP